MTIKDIARLSNVSITTVSLIINHKDENISSVTRERVLKIIEEYNYIPNSVARSMITKKSSILGLVIPDITNMYFAEMARKAEDVAKELGYNMVLCNSDEDPKEELEYIRLLKEKHIDGLILVSTALSKHKDLPHLEDKNFPIVILDRKTKKDNKNIVCFDNKKAGYIGIKHLIEHGHTRIGCITGPSDNNSSSERVEGCRKAFEEYGLDYSNLVQYIGDYRYTSGETGAIELINNSNVTAIFALNDMMALGAYKGIYHLGYEIPRDISVIGIDDLFLSEIVTPSLTTVRQPGVDMGEAAVRMLNDIIKESNTVDIRMFEPKLIKRKSVQMHRK